MNEVNQKTGSTMGGPTTSIEHQAGKVPTDLFLWAALGSIAGSLILQMQDKKDESLFVGQWAPTFLILGIYSKIVKLFGSS